MTDTTGLVTIRAPRADELDATRVLMIRVVALDYGYDYRSRWHEDIDNLTGFYLAHPRHTLLVAVEGATGKIIGTAGVRTLRITSPPHPATIVERYDRERTAELTRVFVAPEARRRGIGRTLVEAAQRWVAEAGDFDLIQLHSRTAVEFWRAMPTTEILDNRRRAAGAPEDGQVYFEMPITSVVRHERDAPTADGARRPHERPDVRPHAHE
jgi:GNAT superfamily N-acetyltransferase